jgi:hypothetical protein
MSDDVRLYPAWREALRQLRNDGTLVPGGQIPRDELEALFGLKPPSTIAEYERHRLRFLQQFTDLRDALLEEEQLMLRSVLGVGWEIVEPAEQTGRSMDDRMRNIHRELRRLGAELTFIRTEALTESERAANADARAKTGQLAAMLGRAHLTYGVVPQPLAQSLPQTLEQNA